MPSASIGCSPMACQDHRTEQPWRREGERRSARLYGSDEYYGGPGHDVFGFQVSAERAEDNDTIYDFQHGDHILVGHREKVFDFFDSNHDGVLNLADDNVFNKGGGKHDLILNFSPLVDDPDGSTFLYVHGVAGLLLDDFL